VAAVRRAVEQALKWMAPATPVFAAEAAPTEWTAPEKLDSFS